MSKLLADEPIAARARDGLERGRDSEVGMATWYDCWARDLQRNEVRCRGTYEGLMTQDACEA